MKFPILATRYLVWHYSEALADWWRIVGNFVWFFFHMFSIGLLLRTLFSPFKRMQEERKKGGFKFEDWGGAIIINVLMRLIGFGVRTMLIAVGAIFILFTILIGVTAFVLWLVLPLAVTFLLVFGFSQLFYLL
ncbi:MAG: hypothetical protein A3D52_03135 [Candidatus Taylorbacteria bacterium RIFCSPHIGHO2_02_FULL_44_36]|uniref:Uncharacterized protein n=1 Tax=Candidatus Taylorbacteria bacterium RIFCSPLOWO2_12_FULL_44_15c TaxID=1802333 RepID=A0A1G2P4Q2_9BACT|nr:MAG: hypothetical protein A3D52_03135 [Candidatus Taylorbacteria bacterium RIFCSPHIGHO2_02_FULL_44_36]OHA39373.1 MAG: hypothetical protein A3I97_00110 [Candidatus Taylorbacteria bacterium RIFCSPLOWO2_02_FULL_44_35]OHA43243.1 MAG: hypothetical protein A3G03_00790 [Candidatus Taylorbacteria bacterium RIFCSPLOWO2_12_FULL_44_15c]